MKKTRVNQFWDLDDVNEFLETFEYVDLKVTIFQDNEGSLNFFYTLIYNVEED